MKLLQWVEHQTYLIFLLYFFDYGDRPLCLPNLPLTKVQS